MPAVPELWAVHGQSTLTWLLQPSFPSKFQGPQSLSSAANGRETVDATIFLGVRLWPGSELWFDGEIDQGFGLGNTFGVAGYVSGEAYKLGSTNPYYKTQRLFYRQTISLNGETETVRSDTNQLAGNQSSNRLVLWVGKFSVADVFDNNSYAHDARHDFLNWSILDSGAFDYAANSWGYTYGAALEWYQGRLAARVGLFDLSTLPNSELLDGRFISQVQFVGELEERHMLWTRAGELKLLYWLTRGDLGSYLDAISLASSTGQVPSTAAVRRYRSKSGVELNLEQKLTGDAGLFLRAGLSQGDVEEDDFTDISQSISGGLSADGSRWRRPDDTVGLAFVVNQISSQGKQYLADGGLGGIVGDGKLPNAGPEQIMETYYSYGLFRGTQLSADYQLINHPAYNRDRGPVSVFGIRLHGQF